MFCVESSGAAQVGDRLGRGGLLSNVLMQQISLLKGFPAELGLCQKAGAIKTSFCPYEPQKAPHPVCRGHALARKSHTQRLPWWPQRGGFLDTLLSTCGVHTSGLGVESFVSL